MLKTRRIKEWFDVLDQERVTRSWKDIAKALWRMVLGIFGRKVSPVVWRHRMRVCLRCPIFDRKMRRCRPYASSQLGCGCYTPYLCSVAVPYKRGCWAKEAFPTRCFGWVADVQRREEVV